MIKWMVSHAPYNEQIVNMIMCRPVTVLLLSTNGLLHITLCTRIPNNYNAKHYLFTLSIIYQWMADDFESFNADFMSFKIETYY